MVDEHEHYQRTLNPQWGLRSKPTPRKSHWFLHLYVDNYFIVFAIQFILFFRDSFKKNIAGKTVYTGMLAPSLSAFILFLTFDFNLPTFQFFLCRDMLISATKSHVLQLHVREHYQLQMQHRQVEILILIFHLVLVRIIDLRNPQPNISYLIIRVLQIKNPNREFC